MNDSDIGLERPTKDTLTPLGVPGHPLAPLSTLQQGSPAVARMTSMGQGARGPSHQSTVSNGVSDNTSLTSLLAGHIGSLPGAVSSTNPLNARKRKLPPEDYIILRRKVSENRAVRMKQLQTKYAEHCSLLCYLHGNGQPGDYSGWRTRLPAVQLNSFLRTNKLNPSDDEENLMAVLHSQNQSLLHSALSSGRLQGPVVGETQKSLSIGNLTDRRSPLKSITKTPAVTVKSSIPVKQIAPPSHGPNDSVSSQEQIVERAKQEAYVMQRIGELQRDGLWAEKRLPKVHEIPRSKAHWDYLLEEMAWLAADFAQERKWKKAAAKKCARMVQKYFQDKEVMAQKAVKNQELQLKRIAGIMAKEVKQFWANVEKLVEFKQHTRLEEKRKKALDQHLSFIVDQTEKYSTLVAESMNTSCPASPKHHSDVEFEPDEGSEDDEETIAKEEALAGVDDTAVIEEVDALKRESELPLEDLLSDYLAQRDSIQLDSPPVLNDDDEDFKASDKGSSDDEETIQEQEMNEGEIDYKQEIDELKADGDLSIEELKAKYNADGQSSSESSVNENSTKKSKENGSEVGSDGDTDQDSDDDTDASEGEKEDMEEEDSDISDKEEVESEKEEDSTLKTLFIENTQGSCADKDKEINDVAAIAQSLQPKGNTLSSTSVVTKIPFLLKHNLREYQHIGLDWLVTMYERKLNGILADEMGLGKTIQTIALCAHLACEKGNWGPHLIVVPTSVMLNWEMEFKKWCPAFKILTYYGSQKERKLKRSGWTKPNAFHVCITSYKLVIQDHQSFRRKKWKYLILDEAQNIKNFKSQRWQLLLNFQTQRRLLLTGTPLQNNLMELWSLMHFLMPNVFESHREFKEWFSNPVTGMIEGNSEYNENIIKRLHKVLRPFLLRRLKSEVETQMPKKYEHVVMCRLSNRQRYLYDDFMSRAKTKETLASGNLLSVINVLMQLRKVCNHPNLFEVRPTVSPFQMEPLRLHIPTLVWTARDYDPFRHINLMSLNLKLIEVEFLLTALDAHRTQKFQMPPNKILTIDEAPPEIPPCPHGNVRISMPRKPVVPCQTGSPLKPTLIQMTGNNHRIISSSIPPARVGTSPLIKTIVTQNPGQAVTLRLANSSSQLPNYLQILQQPGGVKAISVASLNQSNQVVKTTEGSNTSLTRIVPQFAHFVNTPSGRQLVLTPQSVISSQGNSTTTTVMTSSGQRLALVAKQPGGVTKLVTPAGVTQLNATTRPIMRVPPLNITSASSIGTQNSIVVTSSSSQSAVVSTSSSVIIHSTPTCTTTTNVNSGTSPTKENSTPKKGSPSKSQPSEGDTPLSQILKDEALEELRRQRRKEKLALIARTNKQRCTAFPLLGNDLIGTVTAVGNCKNESILCSGSCNCYNAKSSDPNLYWSQTKTLSSVIYSVEDRVALLSNIFSRFVLFVPAVTAPQPQLHVSHPPSWKVSQEQFLEEVLDTELRPKLRLLHPIASAMATQFPDPRLIQYDCGKLQSLDRLLRKLKSGQHRVLIFTQMTRMLDVLEAFLNFHGHIYLRLDGTTKVDQRQLLMERFNADKRIFCFILSTRSGGVGVNLTGADTVIFYDSDWNPTMDAQAQDRCHRIGQTRDVHIYRLVSEKTVEENILKKANQKRMLGDLAIEGGNFTTAYFKSSTIQDLFNVDTSENDASRRMAEILEKKVDKKPLPEEAPPTPAVNPEDKNSLGALESALAQAEDETDVAAAKVAKAEAAADLAEFDENIPLEQHEGPELSKAEMELNALIEQLSGVEKYAMKFVEDAESAWAAEQLAAAEAEIEQQKREWEIGRLASLKEAEEEERRRSEAENEDLITYSGSDARNQVWVSQNGSEMMPMWCPPTPPQDDNDVYIDNTLGLLYEPNVIPEASLPPVFVKKDRKRNRLEAGFNEGRHPIKIRQREEALMHAPKSLFDRPTPAMLKMRQELRLQRYRGLMRPSIQQNIPKSQIPVKPLPEPEHVPDWVIQEDWSILQAIQHIQELTLNLVVISPGHTPNWDLVADVVNMTSRTYRSSKQCRNRYESVIVPREEGKIVLDSPKKQKKSKNIYRPPQMKTGRPLRTSQLYQQDNNSSMTQVLNSRFDAIRSVSNRRAPTVKPLLVDPAMKNPKHAEVLADCSIDYDKPLTPVEVATRRADRIAREKQQQLTSQQTTGSVSEQQMAAVLRIQQQQLQKPTSSSPTTVSTAVTTQATSTTSTRPVTTLAVQEMVVGAKTVIATSAVSSPQQKSAANIVSVQTSSVPTAITTSKGAKAINPAQLQVYKHQQAMIRQNQLRILHSRANAAASAGQKVSVAVTSSLPSQRVQQVKAGGVTRTVTEPEMLALFKRKGGTTTLSSPQLITQSSLQGQHASTAQVGQVATIVKTVPASSLPVSGLTLPQMKAALSSGVKAGTVTTQQIRQLSIQSQVITQQRKLHQQKVTQIGQVAGKSGPTAQLIVQSQKALPTTMTMQQIHQVMKQVQPQQVVVSASSPSVTRPLPIEAGRTTLAGAIKAGSSSQQQAILTQVSAVLQQQQGQPITVRQPVRIQASSAPIVAVAVTQAPTVLTLPPDNGSQQQQ